MLRQSVAARRTLIAALSSPRHPSRQIAAIQRSKSFLPWRKSTTPVSLPVYFPRRRWLPTRDDVRRKLLYWTFSVVAIYLCANIFLAIVIDPLFDWLDEELPEDEAELKDAQPEYEFVGYFLPFPWKIKEVKEPPYKGSDPEWEQFVAINRDKKLQKAIRSELANTIKTSVERSPISKHLGGPQTELKKGKSPILQIPQAILLRLTIIAISLSIRFDEGISWTSVPVDTMVARQLKDAVYPKAAVLGAWAFLTSIASSTAQQVTDAFKTKGAEAPDVTWQSVAINKMKERGDLPAPGAEVKTQVPPPMMKLPNPREQTPNSHAVSNPFTGDRLEISDRMDGALRAAVSTFAKNWKNQAVPARGCFQLDGFVEIQGKKAIMKIHTTAWYDPQIRKFVTIDVQVRHILPLAQRPARG
ncbi:hypothetical protein S7711_01229 [Stachybotrys chartarum IBT 7711]|uniref:Uncharacterized protein n=1 Tax=Stachybotrys chartarum (strain CBS 109288 / IBT 7711) TaxID=1280523 RepID=A0A084AT26_STACB|nr:hypothetical protein S7711_01229 [Stachybotrys chartarum IBT 7711]KFA48554.1 hypothetical protein S40293_00410 [Stachybotrys chartarum IBT 40293]KFA72968.1 hypothetical protein S40288_05078 [Stachybotrys chartarum IBT 40288]